MNKSIALLLAFSVALSACSDHAHDADGGHPGGGHDQAQGGDVAITHYTEKTELFVEFPKLVKGEEAAFAAHLTRLGDFSALSDGEVTARLSGGGHPDEAAHVAVSANPGIFRPTLKPGYTGKRRLSFHVKAPGIQDVHDVGEIDVYETKKAAEAATEPQSAQEGIRFTKEQQWKTPFGVAPVPERTVRESIAVNATIRARPSGEAHIAAPGAGLLRAGAQGFPQIGMQVRAGQILAYLLPRMGGDTDAAALELAVVRARIENEHAKHDRERLEKLFAVEAVAEKRLRDAREHEDVTRAQLVAAQRRAATYSGTAGGIPLKTPVSGTVIAVGVSAGAAVSDGQTIAQIADLARVWLEAKVPEADIARLPSPAGAFFRLPGDEQVTVLEVGRNTRLVAAGGAVERETRTVPVIFEFENTRKLRIGTNLQVNLYSGHAVNGPAVPASAIVDDGGQSVVFVQTGGESFERRVVQPGARDGDWVAIARGLKAGERVVTKGAYDVRLAAAAPATAGHGHAH
jgi:membrane fusion protein, heavy metal efflux system